MAQHLANLSLTHLTIYIQCQRSVPMQEVVCPLYNKVESKGVEAGDGGVSTLS